MPVKIDDEGRLFASDEIAVVEDEIQIVEEPAIEELAVAGFAELGLRSELVAALVKLGYEEPTPIQRESIPILLKGKDLLGQAATGTGKTAAFALPVLERLSQYERDGKPMALVLVPTRELAVQVSEAMHKYGRDIGARVTAIYGGAPIGRQMSSLERGVDVVVATPGRAVDLINRNKLDLSSLEMAILDEADEMLDMGFADELDAILTATPDDRQTILFSATMPSRIDSMARRHLNQPTRVTIQREQQVEGVAPKVRQLAYMVSRAHKSAAIGRILDLESPKAAIVFCRTRAEVDQLTESLGGRGYRAEALHGGMDQAQRDRVMGRLRAETADLLIATDVAARGLDIDHLTHVFNYDVPAAPESYVHRIGRVGRAGREGVAITLAEPRESRQLKTIERVTKRTISIEKLPTVADIRARRLLTTQASVAESLAKGDFDGFRAVVDALSDEHELIDIALAAVKLIHELSGSAADETEIPEPSAGNSYDKGGKGAPRGSRFESGRGYEGRSTGGGERAGAGKGRPRGNPAMGPMTRLFVGAGRTAGVRPQDLVGAIANQSSLKGNEIGGIEITDNFSLVEVPEKAANEVISALKATTIRGKKATVRREKFERR